jgi:hypothetical protein
VIVQQADPASGAFRAYGTVLCVPLDDLPDWLPAWCLDHLGGEPVGVLFQVQQISMVFGLRLAGGRDMPARCHHRWTGRRTSAGPGVYQIGPSGSSVQVKGEGGAR